MAAQGEAPNEEDHAEALIGVTEVIVAVLPGTSIEGVAADYDLTALRHLPGSPDIHLLAVPGGSDVSAVAARLSNDARVRFAEPNFAGGMPEGNPNYAWGDSGARWVGTDPASWTSQPALDRIRVRAAHETSTGAGTLVAVLDTGVQLAHPSLAGRLSPAGVDLVDGDGTPSEVSDGIDEDEDGLVDEATGHGTHVAGVVVAVAPDARILPVRVLNSDGVGFAFSIAEGIRHAAASGADVVNLSLGTPVESQLIREVVDGAAEDMVLVASAGNNGTTQRQYPAASEDVLSVAAVGAEDTRLQFSNYGWVDVAAPGKDVVSTYPQNGFAAWDGTSMAAPFVAGQAALILATGVEDAAGPIRSSAVALDPSLGAGRIDVAASLTDGDAD
ncbi:MAG: S8 family serine peptidase [Actinomycetota bacterium]|nr:S8 family serine peptidase [Actinomycetota bacterium]